MRKFVEELDESSDCLGESMSGKRPMTTRGRLPALVFLFSLVAMALAAPAQGAPTEDETKRRSVVLLLSGYEYEPALADWERIGPDANRILVNLIEDGALRPSLRLKALASLAWFPSRRSRAVLTQKMHARRATAIERRVAMRTLALAFGVDAVDELRGFLRSPELVLREGAIRGLGFIRNERVKAILRAHLEVEQDLDLKVLTDEMLSAQSKPLARPRILPRPRKTPARRPSPASTP